MNKFTRSVLFALCALIFASTIVYAASGSTFKVDKSKYRKIDKDGSTVGQEYFKWAIPGAGVANVIFSNAPLTFGKEDEYTNVSDSFDYDNIKNRFGCRVYFPGKVKDLIDYVMAKYPNYKFNKFTETLYWYTTLDSITPKEANQKDTSYDNPSDDAYDSDQCRLELLPIASDSDFKEQKLTSIPKYVPGTHKIKVLVFLNFQTGTKFVTKTQGSEIVTTEEPTYTEFLISYGECKITYHK
jgi:hypothetical protein